MVEYTDVVKTDVAWLPQIPAHWQMRKIKYSFDERSEKGYPNEPLLVASQSMGVVPKDVYGKRTVEALKDLDKLKLVKIGDYVVSLRSFQGGIEYAYYQGIISPAYTIMKPRQDFHSDYYKFLFKSATFIKLLTTCVTGIREGQNVDYGKLKNNLIPVPPRAEQDQIVRFLDWKVSEINKLIGIRRKEIQELRSFKNAVVSQLVTRGMDSHAEMKYSGVNWLGDIPKRWKVVKLRQILHSVSEKNHPELPLLSVVREKGVIIRDVDDTESNHNYIPDDLSNYKVVRKNQFAMNKMKAWQGSYGVSPYTGIVSPAYFIFDIDFKNLEYFHYAIRSKVYVNFFAQASDGIRVGQWDLQMDKMKEIPFIVPSEQEQEEIVETIKTLQKKCESRMDDLHKEIDVLVELKNKIISDVVTGKIDVRNVTVPEYEHVDDIAEDDSEDVKEETDGEEE